MQITDTRIKLLDNAGKLKAVASITLDECFCVHDLKIVEGTKGLFVIMPGKKAADGSYKDLAHPLDSNTRTYLQETVLAAYQVACTENN